MQKLFIYIFLLCLVGAVVEARAEKCEGRLTRYNLAETLWNDFAANQKAGRGAVVTRRLYSDLYEKMGQDIRAARETIGFWEKNKRPNPQQKMIIKALVSFWANTSISYRALSNRRFVSNERNASLAYDVSILNSIYKPELIKKLLTILKEKPTTFGVEAYGYNIEHAFDKLLDRLKDLHEPPALISRLVARQPNFLLLPTYADLPIAKMNTWTVFPVVPIGVVRGPDPYNDFPAPFGFLTHDIGHATQLFNSFEGEKSLSIGQLRRKVARRLAVREKFLSLNDIGDKHSRLVFEFTWFRAVHELGLTLKKAEILKERSNFPILRLAHPLPGEEAWYNDYYMNQPPTNSEVDDVVNKLEKAMGN